MLTNTVGVSEPHRTDFGKDALVRATRPSNDKIDQVDEFRRSSPETRMPTRDN